MWINADIVPPWLATAGTVLALAALLLAARYAEWRALRSQPQRMHVVGASFLLLVFLQLLSVDIAGQLSLHLLGITTVTLLVGLRFTLLVGAAAVLTSGLFSGADLSSLGLAWVLSVAAPATLSRALVGWLQRQPSRQPFLYILGAGFAGGHLAAIATALLALAVLALAGQAELVDSALTHWPVMALITFPEGFINGTLVTAFVVLYPDLVKHFDSEHYSSE